MENDKILISIGRQFGSGGRAVGESISNTLGIPLYDNELIAKAAEESGFSKDLFLQNDEKRSLFSLSNFFSGQANTFSQNYINEDELFKMQGEVIRNLAKKGSAIFIGRCSDYILRAEDCLSIFISAPLERRISRVVSRTGLSPEEAKSLIGKKDKTRETYYNYFTMGNWGVASNYDLCLDSSILGIEGTARIILSFLKEKGGLR